MFIKLAGTAGVVLLVAGAAWAQDATQDDERTDTQETSGTSSTTDAQTNAQDDMGGESRPLIELSAFAGYTFHDRLDFDGSGGSDPSSVDFYNSIGPRDRLSYGATLGYDITENLQVGALWSRQSNNLELRGFDQGAATAAGWGGPGSGLAGGGGTGGTGNGGTGGTGSTRSFPVLLTTNGAAPYRIGDLDINTFHGILTWNFGPVDAPVRPFVFGGAGVTRYGEVEYDYATVTTNATTGAQSLSMASGRLEGDTRFSTTWGLGVKLAPMRGLGIRVAGRWTPTRLPGGVSSFASGSTGATGTGNSSGNSSDEGWWCNGQWGCYATDNRFSNQFSVTGGLTVRF